MMPDWMKVGANPIRWKFYADTEEQLMKFAASHNLKFDIAEYWDSKFWIGGQGDHGIEFGGEPRV